MLTPRVASLTSASPVLWSDGTPFDGYMVAMLSLPGTYAQVNLSNSPSPLRIPLNTKVPIVQGVLDTSCGIYFNSDIDPPTSKYVFYFVDATNTPVGVGSGLLSVAANPFAVPVPSLPVPTAPVIIPTLET